MKTELIRNIIIANTEISDVVNKIPLASGIRDNMQLLTDENTWKNMLMYLQNNEWIFAALLIVNILYVTSIIIRMNKQKKSETKITNMFNQDGSRNEHLGRRKYHLTTPIFVMILIAFTWFAIVNIQI